MCVAKGLRIGNGNQFAIGLHRRRDQMGKGVRGGSVVAARGVFTHVVPRIERFDSGANSIECLIEVVSLQINEGHPHVGLVRPKLEGQGEMLKLFEQLRVGHKGVLGCPSSTRGFGKSLGDPSPIRFPDRFRHPIIVEQAVIPPARIGLGKHNGNVKPYFAIALAQRDWNGR